MLLTGMDDRDGRTLLARTACTAGTVGIVFNIIRQAVIDDVRQVVHVQSTCSHIRSHENLCEMRTELLHREVALLLREVAVQRLGVVAVLDQLVGNFLCLHLCPAEDDGIDLRIEVHQPFQGKVLVAGIHHIINVVDVLRTLVAAAHDDFLVIVQVTLGHTFHVAAHRSREQQGVAVFRHAGQYLGDTLLESHVQHFVSLVQDNVRHFVQTCFPTVHEVDQTSRRSHDDLYAMAQLMNLCLDGGTAIDGGDVQVGDILAEILQVVCNLQTKLTCRTQHYRLSILAAGVNPLQQWQAECCRLSRTGLCQCDDVVPVAEQIGDYFFLYRHWMFKSKLTDGAANLFAHTQLFKCLQIRLFMIYYPNIIR